MAKPLVFIILHFLYYHIGIKIAFQKSLTKFGDAHANEDGDDTEMNTRVIIHFDFAALSQKDIQISMIEWLFYKLFYI